MGDDDTLTTEIVVGSAAGCIGALAMAFYLVAQDMSPLSVGIFSVLFGIVLGAAAIFWARRRLQRERALGLENLSEAHGLLIWVRVRSPEKEALAQEILVRHGGQAVHVHEIDLVKRPEDLPLHSLQPDPWLDDERLGRP
jgi:membrane protein DedA with SNARE-associated domain